MTDTSYVDSDLIHMGRVLHQAALESQAAIDAIPAGTDIEGEDAVIQAATEPVYCLAELILRTPCLTALGEAVRSRAQAWLDGHYWATLEVAG